MSYYAHIEGEITYKKPSPTVINQALGIVREYFRECDHTSLNSSVCLSGYYPYNETAIFEMLDKLSGVSEIEVGEIEYVGEDAALWHHIFRDGKWIEEEGRVVYGEA